MSRLMWIDRNDFVYFVCFLAQALSDLTIYALADMYNPTQSIEREVCSVHSDVVTYDADGTTIMCDSPAVGRYIRVLTRIWYLWPIRSQVHF